VSPLFLKADGVKVLTLKLGDEVKQISDTRIVDMHYRPDTRRVRLTVEFVAPEE